MNFFLFFVTFFVIKNEADAMEIECKFQQLVKFIQNS